MKTVTLFIEANKNVPRPETLAKKIDNALSKLDVNSVTLIGSHAKEDGYGQATILVVLEDKKKVEKKEQ